MNIVNNASGSTAAGLGNSVAQLGKSIAKLSSGKRLVSASSDAGGLAVSVKLEATLGQTRAVQSNIANAVSYLQTQDSVLKVGGDVLTRMSELKTLSQDPTKSADDKAAYQTEFAQLQNQLQSLAGETFNDSKLFGTNGGNNTAQVVTSADGQQTTQIDKPVLDAAGSQLAAVQSSSNDINSISSADLQKAIQTVANFRAQNGATASRLQAADSTLQVNEQNILSAYSRIADADVAQESTKMAQYDILTQSGVGMLAQANILGRTVLKLIG